MLCETNNTTSTLFFEIMPKSQLGRIHLFVPDIFADAKSYFWRTTRHGRKHCHSLRYATDDKVIAVRTDFSIFLHINCTVAAYFRFTDVLQSASIMKR